MDQHEQQEIIDAEHLKLLRVGYFVSGGFTAFFSMFGLLYAGMGFMMTAVISSSQQAQKPESGPPEAIGWFFGILGSIMFLALASIAVMKFIAARRLKQRKSRSFCMLVAGISCLGIPYGTVLGVLTFMVLGRESVKALFNDNQSA